MHLSLKADTKALTRDLNKVQRKIVPQVVATSLNRASRSVISRSVKDIARVKQISPQKLIREQIKLLVKAKRNRLFVRFIALVAGVRMIRMQARQTAKGVRAGKHSVPGGFIAKMPSGHTGVFKRAGKARLPVKEQTIKLQPEAEQIIDQHVKTTGREAFRKEFERLLAYRLRRK